MGTIKQLQQIVTARVPLDVMVFHYLERYTMHVACVVEMGPVVHVMEPGAVAFLLEMELEYLR